ncbi:hypothetical protein IQ07DRAFT_424770 [Pyrenochaeta sp. DS3sAY3a]|nr:hypothetical protein IQ07DRAFT_424770 [Pyrenochaeta sp. DS3sAY3a]
MRRKFRDIFQGKGKVQGSPPAEPQESHPPTPTELVRQSSASEQSRDISRSGTSKRSSLTSSRSRPLSAIVSHRRESNAIDYVPANACPSVHSSQKTTRLTQIPLDDTGDANSRAYMTLGGDRRLITGESDARHEEDVADRNINRYGIPIDVIPRKPLPSSLSSSLADISLGQQRKLSCATSFASTNRSIPSTVSVGKYVVGQDITTQGGLVDSILPHTESSEHEKDHWKRADWPARAARNESRLGQRDKSGRILRQLEGDGNSPSSPPEEAKSLPAKSAERPRKDSGLPTLSVDSPTEFQHVRGAQAKQQGLGLDGVIDLSKTIDTDQDVQCAPPVTHEVIKPHEHEIVQHNIHREIHNYSYYHRLQPVIDTEILPPRHFIPDSNGEGLMEIPAEKVPKYTDDDRQWDIMVRRTSSVTSRVPCPQHLVPELKSDGHTLSPEGFQRKETIIKHAPTLADLSTYSGTVQPVHFDHKTRECWLGEMTKMDKLMDHFDDNSASKALI